MYSHYEEEGAKMRRNSVHLTTIIILLSILSLSVQFITYYFLGATFITFSITSCVILLFSYILLEQYLSYENCFSFLLLNLFMSFIIILFSYYGGSDFLLSYQPDLFIFIILNWAIPTIYSLLRNLFDRGPKYMHFLQFYRNTSIVFLLFYTGLLVTLLFTNNNTASANISFQFVPFVTIATVIEEYIVGQIALEAIISYFVISILLFIPYGYYCALLLRYWGRIARIVALIILPVLIEVLQSVLQFSKGEIDDIILALIGSLLGALCYSILNSIFQSVTDEDFLPERSSYTYYSSKLHF